MDYDSFAIPSPRAPLWTFAEENPTGSQAQPQAKTTNVQGQPVTSTPVKPSGSQTQTQTPEEQNKVFGMQNPVYHVPIGATINLSVPWHSSAVEIADHNFNIITGKLSKLIINKSLTQLSLGVLKISFWS